MKRKFVPKENKADSKQGRNKPIAQSKITQERIPKMPIIKSAKQRIEGGINAEKKLKSELEKCKASIQVLDKSIEQEMSQLNEVKLKLNREQDKQNSNKNYYEQKYREAEQRERMHQARIAMIQEESDSLKSDALHSEQRIDDLKKFKALVKDTEESLRTDMTEAKEVLSSKHSEIAELNKVKGELSEQLKQLTESEEALRYEDELVEFTIQRMKDTLYSIVILDGNQEEYIRTNVNSIDVKIPNKEDSWMRLKSDYIIWNTPDDCSSFNTIDKLYERTRLMLERSLGYKIDDNSTIEVPETLGKTTELTYIVLALNNDIAIMEKYIQKILEYLPSFIGVQQTSLKVTSSAYLLNADGSATLIKSDEVDSHKASVLDYIEAFARSKEQNGILEIGLCVLNENQQIKSAMKLKYIFINTNNRKSIEALISYGSFQYEDFSLQNCLTNIRVGYLIVLLNEKMASDHLYAVIEAAKVLSESINIIKSR